MMARLILEDGSAWTGTSFGSERESIGEVVFNTGMTGYQEVMSDPSYYGQVVTMTYPLIGNYGITRDDFQSVRPHIFGLVVRDEEPIPSNWRAQYSLDHILKQYDIPGISGIDTRMLTRKIRRQGTMKGMITVSDAPLEDLVARLKATPLMQDQVARVSYSQPYRVPGAGERIVLMDFGAKSGMVQALVNRGCDVVVVPHDTPADDIRKLVPDGILLSNGPGNPKDVPEAIETVQDLLGEYPLMGVCLGHQIFALACGADTEKLKFGHRGGNHPVKELKTGRCYITSQNHGYAVTARSVEKTPLEVTHINNNDNTIEGLRHKHLPAFSLQYHPEAAPGPYESAYLFDEFLNMIRQLRRDHPSEARQEVFARAAERKGELQYAQK